MKSARVPEEVELEEWGFTSRHCFDTHPLTRLDMPGVILPSSRSLFSLMIIPREAWTPPSIRMSFSWLIAIPASGTPNWCRSHRYRCVMSKTLIAAPTTIHETITRDVLSTCRGAHNENVTACPLTAGCCPHHHGCPATQREQRGKGLLWLAFAVSPNDLTPGITFLSGTKQSLRVMSAFCTHLRAILFSIFFVKCHGDPWNSAPPRATSVSSGTERRAAPASHALPYRMCMSSVLPSIIEVEVDTYLLHDESLDFAGLRVPRPDNLSMKTDGEMSE